MIILVPLRKVATVGDLLDLSDDLHLKKERDEKHGTLKPSGGREASYYPNQRNAKRALRERVLYSINEHQLFLNASIIMV
jgi:hypothetical protein